MNTYNPIPKKKAFHKIYYPEKVYQKFDKVDCPYRFEYPTYAAVNTDILFFNDEPSDPCWANIEFTDFNAKLHLSYKSLNNKEKVEDVLNDTRALTWKHTVKAQFIDEHPIDKAENVQGIYYAVGGNAASAVQFYLTDSNEHFLRASLYFNCRPNRDSLEEVLQFIEVDVLHFIESFEWTN